MKTRLLPLCGACAILLGCGGPPPAKVPLEPGTATKKQASVESKPPFEASSRDPRPLREDDWFEDSTALSGISFAYRNGAAGKQYTILETVGGGTAMFDFDVDGWLDLAFAGGGTISAASPPRIDGLPSALFRNLGQFRFNNIAAFARLDVAGDYSHGCISADYDRDGFPDLLVTAYGRCRLWHNLGDGTLKDVSHAAGLDLSGWSTAAAWGDVDRDGWPDLYVTQYMTWSPEQNRECVRPGGKVRDVCPPQEYASAQDRLFSNRYDGSFQDITESSGLARKGYGLGVVAADLNNDGWLDFYVANDVVANHLLCGGPRNQFREAGLAAGVAGNENGIPEGSMGVDLADYNADGLPDLWVTNFELEDNSLYRGNSDGSFTHATVSAGLAGICFPYVGFGTCFDDFDADGWPDLFISNGNVFYHVGQKGYAQPAVLFRNEGGKRFSNQSEQGGPYFSVPHVGRGAALGDLNNDGAPDLVVVHQNEPVTILRNRKTPQNWVGLRLRGTVTDSDAIGAKVSAPYQGRQLVRWVKSGAGYLSQFDNRIRLPCEGAALEVTVTWLGGKRERFAGLEPGRYHDIVEGEGAAETR